MLREKQFEISLKILAISYILKFISLTVSTIAIIFGDGGILMVEIPLTEDLIYREDFFPFIFTMICFALTIYSMICAFLTNKGYKDKNLAKFVLYYIIGSSLLILIPFFKTLHLEGSVIFEINADPANIYWENVNYYMYFALSVIDLIGFILLAISWEKYSHIIQNNEKWLKTGKFMKLIYYIGIISITMSVIGQLFEFLLSNIGLVIPNVIIIPFYITFLFSPPLIPLLICIGLFLIKFNVRENMTEEGKLRTPKPSELKRKHKPIYSISESEIILPESPLERLKYEYTTYYFQGWTELQQELKSKNKTPKSHKYTNFNQIFDNVKKGEKFVFYGVPNPLIYLAGVFSFVGILAMYIIVFIMTRDNSFIEIHYTFIAFLVFIAALFTPISLYQTIVVKKFYAVIGPEGILINKSNSGKSNFYYWTEILRIDGKINTDPRTKQNKEVRLTIWGEKNKHWRIFSELKVKQFGSVDIRIGGGAAASSSPHSINQGIFAMLCYLHQNIANEEPPESTKIAIRHFIAPHLFEVKFADILGSKEFIGAGQWDHEHGVNFVADLLHFGYQSSEASIKYNTDYK